MAQGDIETTRSPARHSDHSPFAPRMQATRPLRPVRRFAPRGASWYCLRATPTCVLARDPIGGSVGSSRSWGQARDGGSPKPGWAVQPSADVCLRALGPQNQRNRI